MRVSMRKDDEFIAIISIPKKECNPDKKFQLYSNYIIRWYETKNSNICYIIFIYNLYTITVTFLVFIKYYSYYSSIIA